MKPCDLLVAIAGEAAWDEILIATAYVDAASLGTLRRLLRKAVAARGKSGKLHVTFITGKRDGLNRVSALRKLLAIEARPPRAVEVRVVCPKESLFHAKCYAFRAPRRCVVVVGSFNWTRHGLDGRGECWTRLNDVGPARPLLRILRPARGCTGATQLAKTEALWKRLRRQLPRKQ